MGRFYKTASPQMVDFMNKIPEQAILKAIEGTDKQIDTEYLYKTETEKLLQKKALSPDEARQKEKLAGYQKEIDEVSQLLSTSPLAALKDKQRIRDLQSKIYQDVTRGEIAAQYKNYDIRQKHLEEETKKATNKDGTIRQEDLDAAMKAFDDAFARGDVDEQDVVKRPGGTAYDLKTGAYRTYSPEKLVNFYDKKEEFEIIAKDWKPSTDTDITQEFIDGNYYVTTRNKDKVLPLKELTFGIYKTMMYDTKAMNYYQQQAKIKSGGDKKLYNQEMTRLFGERVDPDNPFSSFKMKEVKDAEGNVIKQKVQKYDKEGKPEMKDGKPVTEEVPVMEMANPGELFMAAQAAADKQDINEIVRSRTLDLTEAAQMQLQANKEIQVAQALDDIKAAREAKSSVVISTNSAEFTQSAITGKTFQEAEANIKNLKESASKIFDNARIKYLDAINKNETLSALKKAELATKLKNIPANNYKELKGFLQSNNLAGTVDVLTGVDELESKYNSTVKEYQTQEKNYNIIATATKPKGYDAAKTKVDEAKKGLIEWEQYPNSPGYKNAKEKLQKAEAERDNLGVRWGKAINKKLDIDDKETLNANTRTVLAMGGSEIEKIVDKSTFAGFVGALKNITKDTRLFSVLGSGSQAVAVQNGKSTATSFNQLIKDLKINSEQIKQLENGEEITVEGKTISLETGEARVAPDNYTAPLIIDGKKVNRNLGKNAIQIAIKVHDNKTNKAVINEIYIPENEIYNSSLREGAEKFGKWYAPNAFKNEVDANFGAIKNAKAVNEEEKEKLERQKEEYHEVTPEGHRYYPYHNKWIFAGETKPQYEKGALDYYRSKLGVN